MPHTHTVILNWLDPAATAACLAALAAQTHPPDQTLIVQNGPPEAEPPPHTLPPTLPIRILRPGRNLGYCGGVNLGLHQALADGAEHVWLLNSDATPDPDALAHLLARARETGAGLAAPLIRNSSDAGRPDAWGGLIEPNPLHFRMSAAPEEYAAWSREAPDRIWLAGAALLVSRPLAQAIGGLDEALFAYWDDHDYSLRAAAAGFPRVLAPEAIVTHRAKPREDAAPTKPPYYYYFTARNFLLLAAKHGGRRANARAMAWFLARQLATANQLRADPATVRAICAGIADGLAGSGGEYRPERGTAALWSQAAPALGALLARFWLGQPPARSR